jgi:polyisoprenyl-phosphate glycosyltransferase
VSGVELSIVAPCFNEQECLAEFYRRVTKVCEALGRTYEIVLVNDGSRDRTWEEMLALAAGDPRLVCVNLSRNFGHQAAVVAGLSVSRGEGILILDADLQDPPEVLPAMLARLEAGADVVYGQRRSRMAESIFKRATAAAFYRLLEWLTDISIPRDVGDFRLLSRRALDAVLRLSERPQFLRGMVSWIGYRQEAFPYDREGRFAGHTKYSVSKMIGFALDAVVAFSVKPLMFASLAGIITSLVALALFVYSLVSWMSGGTAHGWTSLMAGITLLSGIQLLVLGIIGAYLGRLLEQSRGRPIFIIERIVRNENALPK